MIIIPLVKYDTIMKLYTVRNKEIQISFSPDINEFEGSLVFGQLIN